MNILSLKRGNMAFWDIFKSNESEIQEEHSSLHTKISKKLENKSEKEIIVITCMAGLLARVAFVDLNIDKNEIESMHNALKEFTDLDELEIDIIVNIAIEDMKNLAGIENHTYLDPLNDQLSNQEKFNFVKALFAVAASDSSVENKEAEEIKIITNGLKLEQKHFLAAKATVLEFLKALKKG